MAKIKGPFSDQEAVRDAVGSIIRSIDRKKARDFFASFERTAENVIKQASKIDWGAFTDGRWHKHILLKVAKEALDRDDLSEDDKRNLLECAGKFVSSMDEIIGCSGDTCSKAAALGAIDGAFDRGSLRNF